MPNEVADFGLYGLPAKAGGLVMGQHVTTRYDMDVLKAYRDMVKAIEALTKEVGSFHKDFVRVTSKLMRTQGQESSPSVGQNLGVDDGDSPVDVSDGE